MSTALHPAMDRPQRTGSAAWRLGGKLLGCGLAVMLLAAPVAASDGAAAREAGLRALVAGLAHASMFERLRGVNRFFNRFTYRSDRDLWGREDHWATPAELVARGAGDCEDLAIAKYFTLRRLGVAVASLRLTHMRSARTGGSHMVLLYLHPGADALVLDSLDEVLRPLGARPDLVPVYGLNEAGITVSVPGGGEFSFAHAGRWVIRNWQALLTRSPHGVAPVVQAAPPRQPSEPMIMAAAPQVRD